MNKGDVVRLKSGGPDMTIVRIIGVEQNNNRTVMADKIVVSAGYDNGDAICEWFDKTERKNEVFKISSLEKIK
ncbi:DUF2158 domain-containing protein [uncultured Tenacibaculum sp.]|uniref:YodC family protein n=1 Tax=uncultured Tenacibaculum sp. TaxID=174713 RepID=UPI002639EFFD|nr:DUF2158 domain-containing protein [uncultured Tenacibaculum sp.]